MSQNEMYDDIELVIDYESLNKELSSDSEKDDEVVNPNANTLMCKSILDIGECRNKRCTYAHSIDVLKPRICKYDKKCRIKKCVFIHSNETKEEYCSRNVIVIPEKQKRYQKKKEMKSVIIKTTRKNIDEDIKIALTIGHKFFTILLIDDDDESNDDESNDDEIETLSSKNEL